MMVMMMMVVMTMREGIWRKVQVLRLVCLCVCLHTTSFSEKNEANQNDLFAQIRSFGVSFILLRKCVSVVNLFVFVLFVCLCCLFVCVCVVCLFVLFVLLICFCLCLCC